MVTKSTKKTTAYNVKFFVQSKIETKVRPNDLNRFVKNLYLIYVNQDTPTLRKTKARLSKQNKESWEFNWKLDVFEELPFDSIDDLVLPAKVLEDFSSFLHMQQFLSSDDESSQRVFYDLDGSHFWNEMSDLWSDKDVRSVLYPFLETQVEPLVKAEIEKVRAQEKVQEQEAAEHEKQIEEANKGRRLKEAEAFLKKNGFVVTKK